MNDFRIFAAVYTIAILLSVAPVHAVEKLSSPSEEFPSLPLPPDISLFELTEPHAKRRTDPIENVRRDSDPLPEAALAAIQDHTVSHVAALALALTDAESFPSLPLPPDVGGLRGFRQAYPRGRNVHLALVHRESERRGLPPEVADAVAQIESSYNPEAVGGLGEVGLMQIRPETASLLGYRGTADGLFEPETNLRYSIAYLAGAWRQANGDLCRALMKYRAGHGEERMSPASAEYCRRARVFLASTGSVLGENSIPQASAPAEAHLAVQPQEIRRVVAAGIFPVGVPLPPRRPESTRVASAAVALLVSTLNRSPAGEEANSSNNAARQFPLVTAAQARGAQATAVKTLPAVGAPLPPRRPEPESTRLALVKVRLSTAQMSASIQPRAVAPVTSPARSSPALAAKAQGARPPAVRSTVNVPLPSRRPEPESARAAIKLAAQISVSTRPPSGRAAASRVVRPPTPWAGGKR